MTEQRVAIVTGASSGIGAASARMLAEAGVKVLVNYGGNTEGAEATVAACQAAGVEAFALQGDVGDDETCKAIATAATDRWGRIDRIRGAQDINHGTIPTTIKQFDNAHTRTRSLCRVLHRNRRRATERDHQILAVRRFLQQVRRGVIAWQSGIIHHRPRRTCWRKRRTASI